MRFHPVIMCGGAGVRLWPASTAERPKQFLALTGARSLFQDAVLRVAGVAGAQKPIVVAGEAHAELVQSQLAAIDVAATLLLEPAARDSAPAIAVACAWLAARDADGVALVAASDHYVPDADAFRAAVATAFDAAAAGAIVTLGVAPTSPNTAYGYIAPGEASGAVRKVAAFVEKPDAATATRYIAAGYLWNSGNFIARARVLLDELDRHAPAVARAALEAVATARETGAGRRLGEAFTTAPKISIDYAVMEKTDRAAVLPVRFAWSDLGAWDAVWSATARDGDGNTQRGAVTLHGSKNVYARAGSGARIVAIGARDLAIVAEAGQVLVCDLNAAQAIKPVVQKLAATGDDAPAAPFDDLGGARDWFTRWLHVNALPVWWSLGADHARGGYHEALDMDGRPLEWPRRMRVQARQAYAFAQAGMMGWSGPWRQATRHGLDYLDAAYRRADGLYRTLVNPDGGALDDTARLYDQAFVLLALAAMHAAEPDPALVAHAETLSARLEEQRHPSGGFQEAPPEPFQANAHMHLLEAAMAWRDAGGGSEWGRLAAEIVDLALARFIDARTGCLWEVFDAQWAPALGAHQRVEPGHQFEWAWLLARYGEHDVAQRLAAAGARGVEARRGAAMAALATDFTPTDRTARLWAQTERLKACLVLGDHAQALAAARTFARFLQTPAPGLWRDRLRADNSFVDEPATASSLYHVVTAIRVLDGLAR